MPANELYGISEDFNAVDDVCKEQQFREVTLLIRARLDQYALSQDDSGPTIRYVVAKALPNDVKNHNKFLLERLQIYSKIER
jgi:glutaredoxin 2